MFRHRLKRVGCEEWIIVLTGDEETTHKTVKLPLRNIVCCTISNDATSSNIIKIVEILGCITLNIAIRIYFIDCIDRLSFQSYIIIISGIDDGKFRFGINQSTQAMGSE